MSLSKVVTAYFLWVALCLSLMGLPQPLKTYVGEVCRAGIFSSSQWLFTRVVRYAHNQEKMQFLLTQNVQFALENMSLREDGWENVRLRQALSFVQQDTEMQVIPAEVIGRDPDQLEDVLILDVGYDQGIGIDWPVITAEGLVGHIVQVSERSSVVQLLTRSRVSAIVQQSRAQGIVSWVQGRRFRLQFVDTDNQVQEGDRIISSGLGGRYPKGIPIGRVIEVLQEMRDPVFQSIYLESLVDFIDLEEVFIMRPAKL